MSAAREDTSPDDADSRLDRRTLAVAGVVLLGAVMSMLDATAVNVALNTLTRDLSSSLPTTQWVVSGYTLALASVIPLSGWAGDRFGRRRVWLWAAVLFTTGSLLCAVAWSAGSLIAFRAVQGVGGGLLTPLGITLIAQAAGPARMGRVMSLMGIPMLIGPVVGPVVGGLLLQVASWHWIFLINLPFGVAAVVLGRRILPSSTARPTDRLDVTGLLLLSPGLIALIFGVSQVKNTAALFTPLVLGSVAVAIILVGAFVWHSLRADAPLLDLKLFANRVFAAASVTTFVLGSAAFGMALLTPLYFQQVRGADALLTGLLTTPQALGMAAAMSVSGRLSDRIGAGWITPVGLVLAIAAQVGLTTITASTSYLTIAVILVVLGLGLGASMMPTMSAAYATLNEAAISRATSEIQIVQRVGSTLGSALFAVVLAQRTAAVGPPGSGGGVDELARAFAGTFWWGAALTALAVLPALALPRRSLRAVLLGYCHPLAGNAELASAGARR